MGFQALGKIEGGGGGNIEGGGRGKGKPVWGASPLPQEGLMRQGEHQRRWGDLPSSK